MSSNGLIVIDRGTGLVPLCECNPCLEWDIRVVCYRDFGECLWCNTPLGVVANFIFDATSDPCIVKYGIPPGCKVVKLSWPEITTYQEGTTWRLKIWHNDVEIHDSGVQTIGGADPVDTEYTWNELFEGENACHHLRAELTIQEPGTDPVVATRGFQFILLDAYPSSLSRGMTVVVPTVMIEAIDETFASYEILGPYHGKQEALWVQGGSNQPEPWDEAINLYATHCSCLSMGCGPGEEWGMVEWPQGYEGEVDFDSIGGGFSISGCPWGQMWKFVVEEIQNGKISLWNTCTNNLIKSFIYPDDTIKFPWITEPGNYLFMVPACIGVEFRVHDTVGVGYCMAHIENYTNPFPHECLEDYQDWFDEVPHNHDELLYWLGVAVDACEAEGGRWDFDHWHCSAPAPRP